ncbi:hypothetical protein SZ25_00318 [Candidatus Arcanobacter lacustris]|uniref:Uncharacterized protein n=1 Tax=Candidatus Arcanibacter lacustris TaxID=1607817 RepID=A0A0F5MR97_9RICK|nr:hypothetical protein SZ25_00318 [Candidatus Arcanobacter lacustris]
MVKDEESKKEIQAQINKLKEDLHSCRTIEEISGVINSNQALIAQASAAGIDVSAIERAMSSNKATTIGAEDSKSQEKAPNLEHQELERANKVYNEITDKYKDAEDVQLGKRLLSGEQLTDDELRKLQQARANLSEEEKEKRKEDGNQLLEAAQIFKKDAVKLEQEIKHLEERIFLSKDEEERIRHKSNIRVKEDKISDHTFKIDDIKKVLNILHDKGFDIFTQRQENQESQKNKISDNNSLAKKDDNISKDLLNLIKENKDTAGISTNNAQSDNAKSDNAKSDNDLPTKKKKSSFVSSNPSKFVATTPAKHENPNDPKTPD